MRVPVDGQGRMRADALPAISGPTIVCLQAGNVNTGAFDPVAEIVRAGARSGAWVHVDGAFGLWAAAAPARAHLVPASRAPTRGRPTRTSGSTCPTTAAWPSCATRGAARGHGHHRRLPARRQHDARAADYTPELSRRARGVEVWAALRSLGPRRPGRAGRALLPARAALRRGARARPATRCSTTSCSTRCWSPSAMPRTTRRVIAAHPGRRHLLVRRHGLAGPHGDAHQRLVVGDDGGRTWSAAWRRCFASRGEVAGPR